MKSLNINERYEVFKNLSSDEKEEFIFKFDDKSFNLNFTPFLQVGLLSGLLSIVTYRWDRLVSNGLQLMSIYFMMYWMIVVLIFVYKRNKWLLEKKK